MELKRWVAQKRIRCQSEMVDSNPNMEDFKGDHYKVTLRRRWNGKKRQMTTPFSMGYGLCREPAAEDVLSCLLSDLGALDMSFEEWCGEFGYDTDSRRAEKTYKACKRQSKRLAQFLDSEEIEEARNCEH